MSCMALNMCIILQMIRFLIGSRPVECAKSRCDVLTLSDAVDDTCGRVLYPLEAVQLPIVQTTEWRIAVVKAAMDKTPHRSVTRVQCEKMANVVECSKMIIS